MSLISTNLLANATLGVSFVILISIIAIGIVFDIIGVAVTLLARIAFGPTMFLIPALAGMLLVFWLGRNKL